MAKEKYVAALSYRWLDRLYDPLIRLTMPERKFKTRLIEQATIEDGFRLLDLGCGTATLSLLVKETHPKALIIGLDGDIRILKIANDKIRSRFFSLPIVNALAVNLPFYDGSFDRVVSSLLFHHLSHQAKRTALQEIYRLLKPGGEFHIADWGHPANTWAKIASSTIRRLDSAETTEDNFQGRLPNLMLEAGFQKVEERARFDTIFGTLRLYSARKK